MDEAEKAARRERFMRMVRAAGPLPISLLAVSSLKDLEPIKEEDDETHASDASLRESGLPQVQSGGADSSHPAEVQDTRSAPTAEDD